MADPGEFQRIRPACGVQGCLFAAVALFVILLIGVLVVGIFRFSEPPAGPPRPMSAVSGLPAVGPETPTAGSQRPTAGAMGREAAHA